MSAFKLSGGHTLTFLLARKYPCDLQELADHVGQPHLPELTRHFLFDQLNPNVFVTSNHVALHQCPHISSPVSVFHSAIATFYAPSDESGICGMRRECIRSKPSWRGKVPRRDCAFVVEDEDKPGMKGMSVVRIRVFFSFDHEGVTYPCALVEWFKTYGRSPDVETGMWKVRREYKNGIHVTSVVHLDTILRGAHLLPVFGKEFLPVDFDPADTLDAFHAYYINKYADHHSHEIIF